MFYSKGHIVDSPFLACVAYTLHTQIFFFSFFKYIYLLLKLNLCTQKLDMNHTIDNLVELGCPCQVVNHVPRGVFLLVGSWSTKLSLS